MIENLENNYIEESNEIINSINLNLELEKQKQEVRELAKELREKGGKYDPVIITKKGEIKPASKLNIEEQSDEIIRCTIDILYFIESYLTVFDQTQPNGGAIIPFKLFGFQKDVIEEYKNNRFNIINKYRQGGLTTITCAFYAHKIMFNSNRNIAVVANLLTTAQNEIMYDICEFIESCPDWLKPKIDKKNSQKLKIYENGSKIGAFAISSGLRGYTPTDILLDECAWVEGGNKFWTSTQPTLQTGGRAILISTPNGYDELFYKIFDLAKRKENNFNAIELYWHNDPRYNKNLEWVKNKNKKNEIKVKDDDWSYEQRLKMLQDGWIATSPWFEEQVRNANGDMRKIQQELLCVGPNTFITIKDNLTNEIKKIKISDLYNLFEEQNNSCVYL